MSFSNIKPFMMSDGKLLGELKKADENELVVFENMGPVPMEAILQII